MSDVLRNRWTFSLTDADAGGVVYFARGARSGNIKIGCTRRRLSERIRNLGYKLGESFEDVAVIHGYAQLEASLHQRFRHLSVGREYFRPEPELLEYIATHAEHWPEDHPSYRKTLATRRAQPPADAEGMA